MSENKLEISVSAKVLNTLADDSFDDITSLASILCEGPTVLLHFSEHARIWKKVGGRNSVYSPLASVSFQDILMLCDARTLVVPNIASNALLTKHPLIDGDDSVRFYAGFPVKNTHNQVIGMLNLLGQEPRTLTSEQIQGLELLAHATADRLEREISRSCIEEAFEAQKEFTDAVMDNLGDGVIACNDIGMLEIFNRASREFHSLDSRGDIPPEKWSEYYSLYHADGKTMMKVDEIPLRRAFAGEQLRDAEMVIEDRNGRRRNIVCQGRSMFNKNGDKLGAIATLHDITALKQATAKSDATMKMLQSLIDTCPVSIAVFDLDYKVSMWNPGSETIFGWTSEEVINGPLPFYESSQKAIAERVVASMLQTKKQITGQSETYRKDGTKIDVQLSMLPLLNDQNEIYGFMSVAIDITDSKQREAKLLEINRSLEAASVAKSEFLANMSHEIRTPLNGVLGMTELVLMTQLDDEQREHLQIAQSSANSLLNIISDILDFSKIEAGKLDVENVSFDIEQVVNDVHETLGLSAENKNLMLTKTIAGSSGNPLMGDPGRIRQILLNLVSNAIKFTEAGNISTTISMKKTPQGKTALRIEVKDSGLGMPIEVLARLFQPFSQADSSTTRRFGGTGLGLSISKRLIDLMKGEIGAVSEVGSGSTFWFTLELESLAKAAPKKERVAPVQATSTPSGEKQFRILLAEDNPVNQKIALTMLARLGFGADVVPHGRAALEALLKKPYDLILMDCQMPEMDGYEATREIRRNPDLPNNIAIVALTANAMKGDREKCLGAGMDDYITKPVSLETLEDAILRHIDKSSKVAA